MKTSLITGPGAVDYTLTIPQYRSADDDQGRIVFDPVANRYWYGTSSAYVLLRPGTAGIIMPITIVDPVSSTVGPTPFPAPPSSVENTVGTSDNEILSFDVTELTNNGNIWFTLRLESKYIMDTASAAVFRTTFNLEAELFDPSDVSVMSKAFYHTHTALNNGPGITTCTGVSTVSMCLADVDLLSAGTFYVYLTVDTAYSGYKTGAGIDSITAASFRVETLCGSVIYNH